MQPESVHATGARVVMVGSGLEGMAGRVGSIGSSTAATPAAGEALSAFASRWSWGMSRLGGSVRELGTCAHAAASLYVETDRQNMPAARA